MTNISPSNPSMVLEKIYNALFERNFSEAEHILISFAEHIFDESKKNVISKENIQLIDSLHTNFNELYLTWVEQKEADTMKEIDELMSPEHDNFLIAQCADPASVDDLLFELVSYLTTRRQDDQKDEVTYHLNCYKKYLTA